MANREHQTVRIVSDDTILLASSLIPGNETSVGQVINGLSRLGATVVHKSTALVHVSGHAPAGELRYLINAVRPRNHMPVHGEWRHLRAHAADRAVDRDRPTSGSCSPRTARWSISSTGVATIVGTIPVGYVYVDGLAVGDIGDAALKDRRILGEEGFLSILVAVDLEAGKVVFGPEMTARGFTDDQEALDPIRGRADPTASSQPWPTACATRTRSSTSCAARSDAGSTRPTVAARCSCPRSSRSESAPRPPACG